MRRYLWIICALVMMAPAQARKPKPLSGELVLPMARPIIEAEIAGVPVRLRVGLEAKDLIEINADVIPRLPVRFEEGFDAQVGRETVKGVTAAAEMRIGDHKRMVQLSSHGADCCEGVDGEIGPDLLPYAVIRLLREGVASVAERDFATRSTAERGLELVAEGTPVAVQLAPTRDRSVATAAAGAMLARIFGGAPEGGSFEVKAAFGVTRPARLVRFVRPATVGGFRFDGIAVRMSDFGGREDFPAQEAAPGDIVVKRRLPRQEAWPVVLIGADRLDQCAEIRFDALSRRITLRCAFDG